MDSLKGFSHPLSPKGQANLVGPLPWHYSSAVTSITYKADPKEIKKVLPEPYELSEVEPDGASMNFLSFLSIWEEKKKLIETNPYSAQYKECQVTVRCRVHGVEGRRCVYAWVDKDFAMIRGWFYGFPKKMGSIQMTFNKCNIYEYSSGIGKVGPGTKFTATLTAHDERLAKETVKLMKPITPAELPALANIKWLNLHYFPSTDMNNHQPYVHQIVSNVVESGKYGEVWSAEPEELVYTNSELEEHYALRPQKLTSAFYLTTGQTLKGTNVVYDYLKK